MKNKLNVKDKATAKVGTSAKAGQRLKGVIRFIARDKDGAELWREDIDPNLVVDEGVNNTLEATLAGVAAEANWYLGLIDNASFTAIQAGDTAAKISLTANPPTTNSWQEANQYNEAARPDWVNGAVAGKAVSNAASPAVFSINATVTINGAFLVSSNVKGGNSGKLMAAGSFAAPKGMADTETLEVTYVITGDDDGV